MVIVAGSLNLDLVVYTEEIPRSGETVIGRNFRKIPGGKGGNQAAAAARLGAAVKMIGCVGKDDMGALLKHSLQADGVDAEWIAETDSAPTGVAAVTVDHFGNNTITVVPGANFDLNAKDLMGLEQVITDRDILLTQLEIPLDIVYKALQTAKDHGAMTILNPAPAMVLNRNLLRYADFLTPNETELEKLSGQKTDTLEEIEGAGRKLIEMGANQLIVTLGNKGCMYIKKDIKKYFPAYKVNAVDTTAAGDAFNGALAVCFSQGKTPEEAIEFAMKAGALTATKEGAQVSLPFKREIDHFEDWLARQDEISHRTSKE